MTTLKQLRYLEAVARDGHVGRAAERVRVTQPALSMQIKELERVLGVALFERSARGVTLTEVGAELLERAQKVLRAVDDLEAHAAARRGAPAGRLRLGVIPTIAPYLLPALLSRLAEAHPLLKPQVRESQTKTLLDELQRGDLDLVLAALPLEGPEIEAQALFEDRFFLIAPAGATVRTARDGFALGPLLILEDGHCFRDQALGVWRDAAGEVGQFNASSFATLVEMVAAGMGVTLIPEISLDREARRREVSLAPFDAPEPRRRIALAQRKTSARRDEFDAVAAAARAAAAALIRQDLSAPAERCERAAD